MIVPFPVLMIAALLGLSLGALLAWVVQSSRAERHREAALAAMKSELTAQIAARDGALIACREEEGQRRSELAQLREQCLRVPELRQALDQTRQQKDCLQQEAGELRIQLGETRTLLEAERCQTVEKVALLQGARDQLSNQFKALANEILEDKTKRFTEQNGVNLQHLLDPLKVQLSQFRVRVDEVYGQESKDRSALSEQVRQLMALNQQLSGDAENLTKALKGSSKTQGNWGELILERVLEAGGLRRGEEYSVQESHAREDLSRGRPDVIINLPEQRHLVVDAKVSLKAYEESVSADNDSQREAALARHIESVRSHIKGLSGKRYQELYGLETLDFVIMFVPIEPAFMLAISRDPGLWQEAWCKNVLLVSPSTLLFVVRTVAHLWRQEKQNRSVQEICSRGGQLYDKLCGFVNDLAAVGDKLGRAQSCYEDAFKKLSGGTGNVIWQAEKLRDLGVKPSKTLPTLLVALAHGESLLVEEGDEPLAIGSDPLESQFTFAAAADSKP